MKKLFLIFIIFLLTISISNAQEIYYDDTIEPQGEYIPPCNTYYGGVEIDGLCFDCGAEDGIFPDIVLGYEYCGLDGRPTDPDSSIPIGCTITSAKWKTSAEPHQDYENNAELAAGIEVLAVIQGTNCQGLTFNLQLWEEDTIQDDLVTTLNFPTTITFNAQGIAETSWTTAWIEDQFWSNPEFYFKVAENNTVSQLIQIDSGLVTECTQGDCNQANNLWCNNNQWISTNYCTNCPTDPDCITPECNPLTCDNGRGCCLNDNCEEEGSTVKSGYACINGAWEIYIEGECGKLTCTVAGCIIEESHELCADKAISPYSPYDFICENSAEGFKCKNNCDDNTDCCYCYSTCLTNLKSEDPQEDCVGAQYGQITLEYCE